MTLLCNRYSSDKDSCLSGILTGTPSHRRSSPRLRPSVDTTQCPSGPFGFSKAISRWAWHSLDGSKLATPSNSSFEARNSSGGRCTLAEGRRTSPSHPSWFLLRDRAFAFHQTIFDTNFHRGRVNRFSVSSPNRQFDGARPCTAFYDGNFFG